jgi:hypothetical protein
MNVMEKNFKEIFEYQKNVFEKITNEVKNKKDLNLLLSTWSTKDKGHILTKVDVEQKETTYTDFNILSLICINLIVDKEFIIIINDQSFVPAREHYVNIKQIIEFNYKGLNLSFLRNILNDFKNYIFSIFPEEKINNFDLNKFGSSLILEVVPIFENNKPAYKYTIEIK